MSFIDLSRHRMDSLVLSVMERGAELSRIKRLLADVSAGRSCSLLVTGEPGVGKSWLCLQAAAMAGDFRVVTTRGLPSETHLAYAGLLDVLSPLLPGRLEELTPARAGALRGALRIDGSLVSDGLIVAVACLDVMTATAEHIPLLMIVDDAHWVDIASIEAICFAARRLRCDRVGVLMTARTPVLPLLDQIDIDRMVLHALPQAEALSLLVRLASAPVAGWVAEQLVAATGGNPLALEEATRSLTVDQLSGRVRLPASLPTPQTILRAYTQRLDSLPTSTRAALVLLAAGGSVPEGVLNDALAAMSVPQRSLAVAWSTGILADERPARFAHPLMRAAVLHAASRWELDDAHRVLAGACIRAGDKDRAAWHLGAASHGPDAEASAALADTAFAARSRGALRAAAEAFFRAADTAVEPIAGHRLAFEAACDWAGSGESHQAIQVIDELLVALPPPDLEADLLLLKGQSLLWSGQSREAARLLTSAATVSAAGRSHVIALLCSAAFAQALSGDVRGCVQTARQAEALCQQGGDDGLRDLAQFSLGWALILSGGGAQGYPLLGQSLARGRKITTDHMRGRLAPVPFGQLACWMEDYSVAHRELNKSIERARHSGVIRDLPYSLSALAEYEFRTGDWLAARAHLTEALDRAALTDPHFGYASAQMGLLEAVTGNSASARRRLQGVMELGARTETHSLFIYAESYLGLLELGSGDPESAVEHLEQARLLVQESGLGEPNVVHWAPDLVESLVRSNRMGEAERTLELFERQAERTGRHWAIAAARRCRGLLVPASHVDDVFEEAVQVAQQVPSPFEHARLQLCWGERLRRDGRRLAARQHLHDASTTFDSLGAIPWLERATRELRGSGMRAHRGTQPSGGQLTGQESQVALMVAAGNTNKEVARALFLSPKTVEFHLAHIYRKLAVRNRTELAVALSRTSSIGPGHARPDDN